jgi:hypothetical protein
MGSNMFQAKVVRESWLKIRVLVQIRGKFAGGHQVLLFALPFW